MVKEKKNKLNTKITYIYSYFYYSSKNDAKKTTKSELFKKKIFILFEIKKKKS